LDVTNTPDEISGLLSSLQKTWNLKRELGVKIPFKAVEEWYELKPEILLQKPFSSLEIILYWIIKQNKSKFV
jgi:hypothetical protein